MTPPKDRRIYVCQHCAGTNYYSPAVSRWIRNHPRLKDAPITLNDLDMQVRRYTTKLDPRKINRDVVYSMIVEIKTRNEQLETWQRDACIELDACVRTKAFADQRSEDGLLPAGHVDNHRRVISSYDGKPRRVIHYGVFVCTMSDDTPGASDWILWENAAGTWRRQISVEQFEQLMLFELNPDSLNPIADRQRKPVISENPLFDINDYLSGQA